MAIEISLETLERILAMRRNHVEIPAIAAAIGYPTTEGAEEVAYQIEMDYEHQCETREYAADRGQD